MGVAMMRHPRWMESAQPGFGKTNVGRVERWLSTVAGGALAAYGLKRRQRPGGAAALAGAVLLYRGATGHCPIYGAIGASTAGSANGHMLADLDSDTRAELGGSSG